MMFTNMFDVKKSSPEKLTILDAMIDGDLVSDKLDSVTSLSGNTHQTKA